MLKYLLPLIFAGCGPQKVIKKNITETSESPCVDGVMLNIYQAGCEVLFFGETPKTNLLKIRCSYAPNNNFWTTTSFYAMPHKREVEYSNWTFFCKDKYIKMFSAPYGVYLKE
jgi:hypothetical protein